MMDKEDRKHIAYDQTKNWVEAFLDRFPFPNMRVEKHRWEGLELLLSLSMRQHVLELDVRYYDPHSPAAIRLYTFAAMRGYRKLKRVWGLPGPVYTADERFSLSPRTKMYINTCEDHGIRHYSRFEDFLDEVYFEDLRIVEKDRFRKVVKHIHMIPDIVEDIETSNDERKKGIVELPR